MCVATTGTALHVAARHNSLRCIDLILSPDGSTNIVADVEALATDRQQTALMMAAEHGHVAIVRKLLAAGSDINRQTDECSSALIVASHYGHADCVNLLLGRGRVLICSIYYRCFAYIRVTKMGRFIYPPCM